jgi:hypothetical protein
MGEHNRMALKTSKDTLYHGTVADMKSEITHP